MRALAAILLLPVFAAALALGAALHLDLPAAHRAAAAITNAVLADELAGKVTIGRVERLGPDAIAVADVTIDDPSGVRVMTLRSATVDGPGWLGLMTLLADAPALVLPEIVLEDGDLDLAIDAGGSLGLDRALSDKPGPPGPPPPPSPPKLELWLRRIALARVRVHGAAAGKAIDATLHGAEAELLSGVRELRVELTSLHVSEAGALGAPGDVKVALSLTGHRVAGLPVRCLQTRLPPSQPLPRLLAAS